MHSSLILTPLQNILWSKKSLLKDLFLILFGITLISLSAQFVIPLKPVPLTFQSSTVVLLGMVYGTRLGFFTVLGYLLSGALGIPVFAELSGGLGPLMGATSGYLIGFLPAVIVGGYLAKLGCARYTLSAFLAAIASASIIFAFGICVLAFFVGIKNAFLLGFVPFILTETLKLLAVALVVPRFWR